MEIPDMNKRFNKINQSIKSNHASIFPRNIKCIIVGRTGCGKTNLLIYLLL